MRDLVANEIVARANNPSASRLGWLICRGFCLRVELRLDSSWVQVRLSNDSVLAQYLIDMQTAVVKD